ncbi:MAG: CoA synthetase [Alphaproteobacteria bacterium]|nr:CoA synthetase [Alphaproteobacteria bacterium]
MNDASANEFLIVALARMIEGCRHVAVGNASPVPGAAALLARALSGDAMLVSLLGSLAHNPYTDGGRELFDSAGQGRLDAFFLGGGEIDGQANVNLVAVGPHDAPLARFPGSFGSAYLYFAVPRVILFRAEHTRRVLVPRVSFISAPGTSPPGIHRSGGPTALVTSRCAFAFDRARGRFRLETLHPGHTAEEVRAETGFDYDSAPEVAQTPPPSARALELIRGRVAGELAETYPSFAAREWGRAA